MYLHIHIRITSNEQKPERIERFDIETAYWIKSLSLSGVEEEMSMLSSRR